MNTKTQLLIATLAASVALSFSASAATSTPSTTAPTPVAQSQPSAPTSFAGLLTSIGVQPHTATAHFTAPEFCYVGKMKVACTITNAPSKDPTQTATARFTAPEFCYVGKMKVACTLTGAPSQDPTGTRP